MFQCFVLLDDKIFIRHPAVGGRGREVGFRGSLVSQETSVDGFPSDRNMLINNNIGTSVPVSASGGKKDPKARVSF